MKLFSTSIPWEHFLTKKASAFSNCTFHGTTNINIGGNSGYTTDDKSDDIFSTTIRNNDRYGSDTHRIWVIRSGNDQGLSIALEVKAERDGMLAYSDYWKYPIYDVLSRDEVFNQLIKISSEIKEQVEKEQLPTALIAPMLRSRTRVVDFEHREASKGVVGFKQVEEEPKAIDWRETIYGNRYPDLTKSPPMGSFNNDEVAKKIEVEGEGRNRSFVMNSGK